MNRAPYAQARVLTLCRTAEITKRMILIPVNIYCGPDRMLSTSCVGSYLILGTLEDRFREDG